MDQQKLRATKSAAQLQLGQVVGVEGFGIGDGVLRIYVNNADVCRQLPQEYQGIPIEFIVSGDIMSYFDPVRVPVQR